MNTNNLVNLRDRNKEERTTIAKLGAKASAEKKREIRTLRDELLAILDSEDSDGISEKYKISLELIKQARSGNVKAFELIHNVAYGKTNYSIPIVPIIIDDIK